MSNFSKTVKWQKLGTYSVFAAPGRHGNPAAVYLCSKFPTLTEMQVEAQGLHRGASVFVVVDQDIVKNRSFSPGGEISFCGHGSVASACALLKMNMWPPDSRFLYMQHPAMTVKVNSYQNHRFGLVVKPFPAKKVELDTHLYFANFDSSSEIECYLVNGVVHFIFETAEQVESCQPNFDYLLERGLFMGVSAPHGSHDIVTRYFGPSSGIKEDSATGSFHAAIAPYWSERLQVTRFLAEQRSKEGGAFECVVGEQEVEIIGRCVPFQPDVSLAKDLKLTNK